MTGIRRSSLGDGVPSRHGEHDRCQRQPVSGDRGKCQEGNDACAEQPHSASVARPYAADAVVAFGSQRFFLQLR